MFFGALALFLYNYREATVAGQASNEVLSQMVELIPETSTEEFPEFTEEMKEVVIEGYSYIGYLSIPKLELNLPIMADWDYKQLKIAPCRYTGTIQGENLVLMAHNYERHFGLLSDLSQDDQVIFTDMDGASTFYQVVARDVLMPAAVEEMTAGKYDLTLFTCSYGGKSRITVYCDKSIWRDEDVSH